MLRQNLPAGVKPHKQKQNAPEVKKHRVFRYALVVFVRSVHSKADGAEPLNAIS